MTDDEATADPTKPSKRDRFKGAIARTKTKLKKKEEKNDADVEDFLAAGRDSISTGRPSVSDTLHFSSDRPSTSDSQSSSPSQFTSFDKLDQSHPSPRKIPVPRIDVSNSQRWPGAQPLGPQDQNSSNSLLRPEYQGRSQSASSLAKRPGRARGLSVAFTDRPPVIIGEGGDEAETPPIEISKIKARARSMSPPRTPKVAGAVGRLWSRSPPNRSPLPNSTAPPVRGRDPGPIPSPGLKRAPTGFDGHASNPPPHPPPQAPQAPNQRLPPDKLHLQTAFHPSPSPHAPTPSSFSGPKRVQTGISPSPMSESRQALEREFDMSLGLTLSSTNSNTNSANSQESVPLYAPKPIHPPVQVPHVRELPVLHGLKSAHGTKNLRGHYERSEGHALRQAYGENSQQSSPQGSPSRQRHQQPPIVRKELPPQPSQPRYYAQQ